MAPDKPQKHSEANTFLKLGVKKTRINNGELMIFGRGDSGAELDEYLAKIKWRAYARGIRTPVDPCKNENVAAGLEGAAKMDPSTGSGESIR